MAVVATGSASTSSRNGPTRSESPLAIAALLQTRSPLSDVPEALPRSTRRRSPAVTSSTACMRATLASSRYRSLLRSLPILITSCENVRLPTSCSFLKIFRSIVRDMVAFIFRCGVHHSTATPGRSSDHHHVPRVDPRRRARERLLLPLGREHRRNRRPPGNLGPFSL